MSYIKFYFTQCRFLSMKRPVFEEIWWKYVFMFHSIRIEPISPSCFYVYKMHFFLSPRHRGAVGSLPRCGGSPPLSLHSRAPLHPFAEPPCDSIHSPSPSRTHMVTVNARSVTPRLFAAMCCCLSDPCVTAWQQRCG